MLFIFLRVVFAILLLFYINCRIRCSFVPKNILLGVWLKLLNLYLGKIGNLTVSLSAHEPSVYFYFPGYHSVSFISVYNFKHTDLVYIFSVSISFNVLINIHISFEIGTCKSSNTVLFQNYLETLIICFYTYFSNIFWNSTQDFDRNDVESIDQFGENCHLNHIGFLIFGHGISFFHFLKRETSVFYFILCIFWVLVDVHRLSLVVLRGLLFLAALRFLIVALSCRTAWALGSRDSVVAAHGV